jgi:transposase
VNAYEGACVSAAGGAYLRRGGLYSSQITEWRRLRDDAGVLEGKQAGQAIGRLSPEQAEIARLRQDLEAARKRLARTETALEIMGKAHALLEDLSESAAEKPRKKPCAPRIGI